MNIFKKFIIFIFLLVGLGFSEYPIRVFRSGEINLESFRALCARAKKSNYTHVVYGVRMKAGSDDSLSNSEWNNGVYIAGEDGTIVRDLKEHFIVAHEEGLKLIPSWSGPNKWSGDDLAMAKNPNIRFQPSVKINLQEEMAGEIKTDIRLVKILKQILRLFVAVGLTFDQIIEVSNMASLAEHPQGLTRTFKSLLEDVYLSAFEQFQDSITTPSYVHFDTSYTEIDFLSIGYDEMLYYDAMLKKGRKLLAGKSQEDLRWMYNYDTLNHCNIQRYLRTCCPIDSLIIDSINSIVIDSTTVIDTLAIKEFYSDNERLSEFKETYIAECEKLRYQHAKKGDVGDSMKLLYFDDFYYEVIEDNHLHPHYIKGVRALIAQHIAARVQDVADILPNTQVFCYGDMFDPEHVGGYLETDSALVNLKDYDINTGGTTVPIQEKLIFLPWQYQNAFIHDAEFNLYNTFITDNKNAQELKLAAALATCGTLPTRLARRICRAIVGLMDIVSTAQDLSSKIDMTYNSEGKFYDASKTSEFFINNGFRHIYVNAFEKDEMYSSTTSRLFNTYEYISNLSDSIRERYIPGYWAAAWGGKSYDRDKDEYNQPIRFNIIESVASLYSEHDPYSGLLFGNMVYDSINNILIDSNQISDADYFTSDRNKFGRFNYSPRTPHYRSTYFKALLFCNKMSKMHGLDTVYTYGSIYDVNKSIRRGYAFYQNNLGLYQLDADYSKNGFRLPTFQEVRNSDYIGNEFKNEFIWHPESLNTDVLFELEYPSYNHDSLKIYKYHMHLSEVFPATGFFTFRLVRNVPDSLTLSDMTIDGLKEVIANTVLLNNLDIQPPADLKIYANEIRILPEFYCNENAKMHIKLK